MTFKSRQVDPKEAPGGPEAGSRAPKEGSRSPSGSPRTPLGTPLAALQGPLGFQNRTTGGTLGRKSRPRRFKTRKNRNLEKPLKNLGFSMVFHGFLGFRGVVFHVFFEKTVKKHVYNRILRKKFNRLLNEREIATKRSSKTRKEAPQDQPRRLQRGTRDFDPGSRCAMFGVPGPPKDQRSLKKQPCWLQSRLQDWKDWRLDA